MLNTLKFMHDSSKPNGQMRKDIDISIFRKMFPSLELKKLSDGISEIYNKNKKFEMSKTILFGGTVFLGQ